jgi:hypothetical protein
MAVAGARGSCGAWGVWIARLALVVACLGLAGCAGEGSDGGGAGGGNGGGNGGECTPPDEPTMSFTENIAPLWDTRCAIPSCHDAASPQTPTLEPDVSYANTVNVASVQQPSLDLVTPGIPDESYLFQKIDPMQQFPVTGALMPLGCPSAPPAGGCLTADEVAAIELWISECALDN